MKIKSVLEAQLSDKPEVSFARLKRVAREVQELTDAELDKYESEENLLILTIWKTLYHSDIEQLDNKFGEHDEFNIPEFSIPWYRWEVDGVWIIMKVYSSGSIEFEVLPATTRQQPQDRYLRQRHDQIMDPAAYESVMEAKYFKEDDKYQCLDCEGKGGHYVQDGPDDYDVERCDMCGGKGWIRHRLMQNLLHDNLYKPSEFKRLKEAKYAEPNVMSLVGDFYFDDRNKDEITEHERVVIKVRVDHDADRYEETNAVLLDDIKWLHGGRPLEIAKKLRIGKGTEASYQRDKHGWMVSNYIMGPGPHSPWNVSGR